MTASHYLLQPFGDKWLLRAEYGPSSVDDAEAIFRHRYPDAFIGPHRIESLSHADAIEAACAARTAAKQIAGETGLPVRYSDHGGICLSRGPLVRTDLAPTAEAVLAAWQSMGESYWCQPDMSTSATGSPYFDSDD